MAPHSSALAWKIPWKEEPGGLQSMGSLRVRPDWATSLSLFPFMHWRRKWQPTPEFLPGESQGRGSLLGCCLWVAQSQTRLKRLISSSSSSHPWIDLFNKQKPNTYFGGRCQDPHAESAQIGQVGSGLSVRLQLPAKQAALLLFQQLSTSGFTHLNFEKG